MDGQLTILGTKGFIEFRKYVDITGRQGANQTFVMDREGTQYINCEGVALRSARNCELYFEVDRDGPAPDPLFFRL